MTRGRIGLGPGVYSQTTHLLLQVRAGDEAAAADLMPLVYDELHALAAGFLRRERADHTLQPTALINEVYIRLIGEGSVDWESRAHFLAVAARAMRRLLVNHALARKAGKRGGGAGRLSLSGELASLDAGRDEVDALAIDDALKTLAGLDERKAKVIEMRFFAGMTVEEVGHVLGVSVSTVEADWRMARAWLLSQLEEP
ncbi:MAG: sigma-70 family RNA polymerase sigma factor [Phycisphaerae bacterium]|nr:sigma-70 family RNA polymerase sigma factor [Phycisphaerae bacterium]MCZ2400600.1 sigma-70 family RNA polymerase sigma factor [Phycisphaerae bacterium]